MGVKINELIIRTKIENKTISEASTPTVNADEQISIKKPVEIVSVNKINRER